MGILVGVGTKGVALATRAVIVKVGEGSFVGVLVAVGTVAVRVGVSVGVRVGVRTNGVALAIRVVIVTVMDNACASNAVARTVTNLVGWSTMTSSL